MGFSSLLVTVLAQIRYPNFLSEPPPFKRNYLARNREAGLRFSLPVSLRVLLSPVRGWQDHSSASSWSSSPACGWQQGEQGVRKQRPRAPVPSAPASQPEGHRQHWGAENQSWNSQGPTTTACEKAQGCVLQGHWKKWSL